MLHNGRMAGLVKLRRSIEAVTGGLVWAGSCLRSVAAKGSKVRTADLYAKRSERPLSAVPARRRVTSTNRQSLVMLHMGLNHSLDASQDADEHPNGVP
jgi:hypothetical protein